MITRTKALKTVEDLLTRHPVVGIIGARQVGKTTLARQIAGRSGAPVTFFDLENPEDLARLADPLLALKHLDGLVIIDEVQHQPGLFPVLRVLVDRPDSRVQFLVLGSASPELLRQGSETLAGRIYYYELSGFGIDEVGQSNARRLWLRGGFPLSYLAPSLAASEEWRRGFIRTFLERDLPQLGITVKAATLRRFWIMLAHYHGQVWNASEFARSFGVADTTIRHYLEILTSALMVRQLLPWYENLSKRQVKSPKIYLIDSGLVHTLLGITTREQLESHPRLGASWEGFVIEQLIRRLGVEPEMCYFWATHSGVDLDLLIVRGQKRFGFEIKRTTTPVVTRSMRQALADLNLERLDIIHAGENTFPLADKIRAVAFSRLLSDVEQLD